MPTEIINGEPIAEYHANAAIGSGLIRAYLESPQLFHDYQTGYRPGAKSSLLFGIASHVMLLEPETFDKHCALKPAGLNLATKEGKAWKEQQGGRVVVPDDKAQDLRRMHDRMPSEVRRIMESCHKEQTVRTAIDGLRVQCRPDLWDMKDAKFDLKTCKSIHALESSIWKYGYHIQDRWYSRVIREATGRKTTTSDLIFVETAPPYRWRIVSLDPDYQTLADHQIGVALRGIAERTKSGNWSESEDDLREIASPPDYAMDCYSEESEDE